MGTGSLSVGTEAINASTLLLLFVKFIIAPRIVFFLPDDVGVATAGCVDTLLLLAATVLDAVVVVGALITDALACTDSVVLLVTVLVVGIGSFTGVLIGTGPLSV